MAKRNHREPSLVEEGISSYGEWAYEGSPNFK